jgi:GntR family transcriptional regulator
VENRDRVSGNGQIESGRPDKLERVTDPVNKMKTIGGSAPLYSQIKDLIIEQIVKGVWSPGDLLPSETRLGQDYGVSQGTVRKALDVLASENLVMRHQGKGTFVAAHTPDRALFHFFHITSNNGVRQMPSSREKGMTRRRALREETLKLRLPTAARVIQIDRVRALEGRPVIAESIVVPAKIFPDLDRLPLEDLPNNLYQLYETRFCVTISRAVEHLRAIAASPQDAAWLGVEKGSPLQLIERVAHNLSGVPVELRISRCNTRDYYYESVLD